MTGTLINVAAVIAGGIIGLVLHDRLPRKIVHIIFQAIGLFTLFLGVSMALKTNQILLMIISLVAGSAIGELIDIDKYVKRFSDFLKTRMNISGGKFTEGLTTAFLLYCMGSLTILGAIEEGLNDDPSLLLVKSLMDGVSSIALASALGVGVVFSVIPLLIYQGGLTLFASAIGSFFSTVVVDELTAVGGILLLGLGINILEIKNLRILNMIPSLIVIVILVYFFA